MPDSEKKSDSRFGLDVGTSRIVLARQTEKGIDCRAHLNAFVRIPFSRMTESVFKKENIPCSVDGDEIVIYGNDAEKFANIFHVETRRPMSRGLLNPDEPAGPAVIREIVGILAGRAAKPGQRLCASLPGRPLDAIEDLKYHQTVVEQTASDFGFTVTTINEGLAVIYSELADSNYTGIGVSCGGGMCNVCLGYLSVPVVSFSIAQAGDFVDTQAAAAAGEVATRVRLFKEQDFRFNGTPGNKMEYALTVYYDEMIRGLVEAMTRAFSESTALPKLDRPVPLVLSGGTTLAKGFLGRFEKALKQSPFPVPLSEVKLAAEPLNATARGALVSALSE
jgi:hypothetical protein